MLATVGTSKENLSALTDFVINFEDRQKLRILENMVADLQVILPELLRSVVGIKEQSKFSKFAADDERMELEFIRYELDEYIQEIKVNVERAKALKCRAQSTARLVRHIIRCL